MSVTVPAESCACHFLITVDTLPIFRATRTTPVDVQCIFVIRLKLVKPELIHASNHSKKRLNFFGQSS